MSGTTPVPSAPPHTGDSGHTVAVAVSTLPVGVPVASTPTGSYVPVAVAMTSTSDSAQWAPLSSTLSASQLTVEAPSTDATPLATQAGDAADSMPTVSAKRCGCCTKTRCLASAVLAVVLLTVAIVAGVRAADRRWNDHYFYNNCYEDDTAEGLTEEPVLKQYATCGPLVADLREGSCGWYSNSFSRWGGGDVVLEMASADGAGAAPTSAPSAPPAPSGTPNPDYSDTNNQVADVDEADIVKTDGHYLYTISQSSGTVTLARSFPVLAAQVLSTIELQDDFDLYPTAMFIDSDSDDADSPTRLLVFGSTYTTIYSEEVEPSPDPDADFIDDWMGYSYMYEPERNANGVPAYSFSTVTMLLFDVTDRAEPRLQRRVDLEGGYITARKIGHVAYVVSNAYPHYYAQFTDAAEVRDTDILPLFRDSASAASNPQRRAADDARGAGRIADYVPVCDCGAVSAASTVRVSSLITVTGLSMRRGDETAYVRTKTVAGRGYNVYASTERIFLAGSNWNWQAPHTAVLAFRLPTDPESDAVANSVDSITFDGVMRAPGNILNQFSMDEYDGHFRIATTSRWTWDEYAARRPASETEPSEVEVNWSGSTTVNNVYVFDLRRRTTLEHDAYVLTELSRARQAVTDGADDAPQATEAATDAALDTDDDVDVPASTAIASHASYRTLRYPMVGWVEGLAPGEEIKSSRFVGDRIYMVTFETTDPLFVIDGANPVYPRVLGELKLPGFSTYLHPVNSTHLIGFGQEADVTEDGTRAITAGLKISLFDVTDVATPIEAFNVGIGDRGSYSEALHEHKAFLFDAASGLLVVPVSLRMSAQPPTNAWEYGESAFSGALAFTLTHTGFELRAAVSHDAFWAHAAAVESQLKYMPDEDGSYSYPGEYYNPQQVWGSSQPRSLPGPWALPETASQAGDALQNFHEWARETVQIPENPWALGGDWNRQVRRSLYIDDALWTLSSETAVATSRESWQELTALKTAPTRDYQAVAYAEPL